MVVKVIRLVEAIKKKSYKKGYNKKEKKKITVVVASNPVTFAHTARCAFRGPGKLDDRATRYSELEEITEIMEIMKETKEP